MTPLPSRAAGRPSLLRALNSLNALAFVQREGASTATRLASAIGVSRTAIESVLADLVEAGWLARGAPEGAASLGRPAATYDLGPDVGHIAAIEFDSMRVGAAVCDYRGEFRVLLQRDVADDLPGDERVAVGLQLLDEALGQAGVDPSTLRCVGVASPGAISGGRVVHFGGHGMPDWVGRDLASAMHSALGVPVAVEGDSALGALAERRLGKGRSAENFVYIYSGRRTGAAIISDGHLRRGSHGAVGLIGELPELRWREVEARAYGESVASGRTTDHDLVDPRRAAAPDHIADDVPDFAAILGLGISAMVLAVDPELVLIGGAYRAHIRDVLDDIRSEVARRCPIPPEVELGEFGADAVIHGAVCLAMDTISATLTGAVELDAALPSPTELTHRSDMVAADRAGRAR